MNRCPPANIRKSLRQEVGFGCPVPGCRNPYLTWHHFDPPWSIKNHHDLDGMIALCEEHHSKADAGAFTNEQLRKLKSENKNKGAGIKGRFDWLRNELLVAAGSSLYQGTLTILQIGTKPIIWLTRDHDGYLLLNIKMLSMSGDKRLILEDNNWLEQGCTTDFECPPSGRLIRAKYPNGDSLKIEFFTVSSSQKLKNRYSGVNTDRLSVSFPLTVVEIENHVQGANISFTPSSTIMKNILVTFGVVIGNGCVFHFSYDPRLLDPELYGYLMNFLSSYRNSLFFQNFSRRCAPPFSSGLSD